MYCLVGQCVVVAVVWLVLSIALIRAVQAICFRVYCWYPELLGRLWMDRPFNWLQLRGTPDTARYVTASVALHVVLVPVMVAPYLFELAARIPCTTWRRSYAHTPLE